MVLRGWVIRSREHKNTSLEPMLEEERVLCSGVSVRTKSAFILFSPSTMRLSATGDFHCIVDEFVNCAVGSMDFTQTETVAKGCYNIRVCR